MNMKIFAMLGALAFSACAGSKKENPPQVCQITPTDNYVQSINRQSNEMLLGSFAGTQLHGITTFEKSAPSGIQWAIKNQKIIFGSEEYTLKYDEVVQSWVVFDKNETIAGNLVPFENASCDRSARLELTMFLPEETASAYISYPTE